MCFQKKHHIACDLKKMFSAFSNRNYLKTQFSNYSFFTICFKIVIFIYEIAILNAPFINDYRRKKKKKKEKEKEKKVSINQLIYQMHAPQCYV
jgi:hypothetical protein